MDSLDYGDPSAASSDGWDAPTSSSAVPDRFSREEDTQMDAGADAQMDEAAPRASSSRQRGPHMYRFPEDMAVAAGGQRGPASLPTPPRDEAPADVIPPPVPTPIGRGKDVRLNALHLQGVPIAGLSTSRLFAYVSHWGAQPIGVEWIDDERVNIVFADEPSARLALEYLCPPIPDRAAPLAPLPSTTDIVDATKANEIETDWPDSLLESCLMPRRAHRFPEKLYTGLERDALAQAANKRDLTPPTKYDDDVPSIYRELDEEDQRARTWSDDPNVKNVQRLLGTLWVRYAIESADVKDKQARQKSKWYREHGSDAGKDVVTKPLEVGARTDKRELLGAGDEPRERAFGEVGDPRLSPSLEAPSSPSHRRPSYPLPPHLMLKSAQPLDVPHARELRAQQQQQPRADLFAPRSEQQKLRAYPSEAPSYPQQSGIALAPAPGKTDPTLMRMGPRRSASPVRDRATSPELPFAPLHPPEDPETSMHILRRGRGSYKYEERPFVSREDLDDEMERYARTRDTTPDDRATPPPMPKSPEIHWSEMRAQQQQQGGGGGKWKHDAYREPEPMHRALRGPRRPQTGSSSSSGGNSSATSRGSGGTVRVKGRGMRKAPGSSGMSGWDDGDDYGGQDDYRESSKRSRKNGGGGGYGQREYETEAPGAASLADRLGAAPGLSLAERMGESNGGGGGWD